MSSSNGGETLQEVQDACRDRIAKAIKLEDRIKLQNALEEAEDLGLNGDLVDKAYALIKDLLGKSVSEGGIEKKTPEKKDNPDIEQDLESALKAEMALLPPESKEKLSQIDLFAEKQMAEGNDMKAIEAMEMALIFRRNNFGLNSTQVYVYREKVAREYNRLSVVLMEQDKFAECAELLEKAQILGELYPNVVAVTYNNLGCFYRKKGQNRTALNYLREALNVEKTLADSPINISDTHLNLCAIYSELKKHKEAYFHVRLAIRHIAVELYGRTLGSLEDPSDYEVNEGVEEGRIISFTAALFNLAVQLEFLGKWEQSLRAYEKVANFVGVHKVPQQLKQTILVGEKVFPPHTAVTVLGTTYNPSLK